MLKDMNIFVRSHMSAPEGDQVPAVRVRWEREKRKHAEEPAPKKVAARQRKRRSLPGPRRGEARQAPRTAAEVAQVEAQAQAEKAAELAALELERPVVELRSRRRPRRSRSEPAPCLSDLARPRGGGGRTRRDRWRAAYRARGSGPVVRRGDPRAVHSPRIRRACRPRKVLPVRSAPAADPPIGAAAAPPPAPRARRRKGRRPEERQEGQALVGGSRCGAGEHPEDLAGHEGSRGTQGRRSDEPSFREVQAGRAAEERSGRRPDSGQRVHLRLRARGCHEGPATQIVQFAFKELGLMVTVNQRLDSTRSS